MAWDPLVSSVTWLENTLEMEFFSWQITELSVVHGFQHAMELMTPEGTNEIHGFLYDNLSAAISKTTQRKLMATLKTVNLKFGMVYYGCT